MGKGSESGADGSWALPTPADKRQLQAEHGAANRRQLPLGMFSSATGIKKNFKKGWNLPSWQQPSRAADLLIQASCSSLQTWGEMFEGSI